MFHEWHHLELPALTRSGDYSYGIYIYAFPVQQTVIMIFPNIQLGWYLLACFSVTLALAVASWHLVERRALLLKPRRPARDDPARSPALQEVTP